MKDFADVTPTEKKREARISKEGRLEKEPSSRRKKKEQRTEKAQPAVGKKKPEGEVTEVKESIPAEVHTEPPKEEPAEKPAEKARPKTPKPVEKIQYSAGRKVPELALRKKKPKFRRQEHYKKRLDLVWRKPSGIDSKQHEGKRGKGKKPSIGYKNPEVIRGLHPLGYRPVLVHNPKELGSIDSRIEGAVIASAVGRRKRNEIIREANRLKITVLNPRRGEL